MHEINNFFVFNDSSFKYSALTLCLWEKKGENKKI